MLGCTVRRFPLGQVLRGVLEHCALPDGDRVAEWHAPGIRSPSYYDSRLTPADLAVIHEETAGTAGRWGYTQG